MVLKERNSKLFKQQRGISLTGLIVILAVLGVAMVFAGRMIPAYIEYNAIKSGIVQAKQGGGSDREMRQAFDKHTSINDVEAVRGRDLVITRANGEPQLSFAYEKRLPLLANVSLLIDFEGSTDPAGAE